MVRRDELERYVGATVPDVVPSTLRLLFVGINPGLWTAAVQAHFARPGNRFYRALHAAGILERRLDVSDGFSDADLAALEERGIGITNLVDRATARADELSRDELRRGAATLREKVGAWQPRVVAIVGVTAYRTAFERPDAQVGRQEEDLAGSPLWVLPNPSGLNAHYQVDDLAELYGQAARAAGIIPR